jgi:uncharacterized membrane protein YfcA
VTLALALGLGLLIGLSLGALGGGGSILTVPALVYAVGEGARPATTGSLVIVGITAAVASLGHARAGRVRWGAGAAFGAAGVAASFAGTALNARIDPDLLLLCFAGLMLFAAGAMFTKTMTHTHPEAATGPVSPTAGSDRTAAGTQVTEARPQAHGRTLVAVRVILAGLVVGFLTGFLGVGGGFVIVPALVLTLKYDMPTAVGTSLLVISLNSAVALLARSGNQSFHWSVIAPFTLAAIAGSMGGKRVADRVSGSQLTRAFAGLLLVVAVYVVVRVLLAIT